LEALSPSQQPLKVVTLPPAGPLSLDHVQIALPPGVEEQARAFYGGLLGLVEVAKPATLRARGGVWYQVGALQLHLGVETGFRPARKAHPAFVVADVERLRRHLEAKGVIVHVDDALPGRSRFYCDDPFGNRLEFVSQ
jgi:catechol 2,3-dioxygenase-like lactoylglutathione lyase family enzyme